MTIHNASDHGFSIAGQLPGGGMKAILIDPFTQTITEVEHNGNFMQIYDLIDAQTFTLVRINADNAVFIDDEGLLGDPDAQRFFRLAHYPQPLAGKGLVLGEDDQGETVATTLSVEDVRAMVTWPDVVLEGFVPVNEVGFLFGEEVPVFGQRAVFKQREQEDDGAQSVTIHENSTDWGGE